MCMDIRWKLVLIYIRNIRFNCKEHILVILECYK